MNEPAIKQWQIKPIPGGWGLIYELHGQRWSIDGPTPRRIVAEIAKIQAVNNAYVGDAPIWDYCNAIWTAKAPDRAVKTVVRPVKPSVPSRDHWEHGPERYGPILWFWLHSFGMKFDKDGWDQAINRITDLLNPETSPMNGCPTCFSEWQAILGTEKPFDISNEDQAARWSFNVHNRINKKLGKPTYPLAVAAKLYGWKIEL